MTTKNEVGNLIHKWVEENRTKAGHSIRFGIPDIGQHLGLNVKNKWKNGWKIFEEYMPD